MFITNGEFFHTIDVNITEQDIPQKFTYPFYYTPHPLSLHAANEVMEYLTHEAEFSFNFGFDQSKPTEVGKMFGVLVVRDSLGNYGYLAGFSGKIGDSAHHNGFVPQVYDVFKGDGFYRAGELKLNDYTRRIEEMESNSHYHEAQARLEAFKLDSEIEFNELKTKLKVNKKSRKTIRETQKDILDKMAYDELLEKLRKESIRESFAVKDLKAKKQTDLTELQASYDSYINAINALKEERRNLSNNLQRELHKRYRFLNARKETKDLLDIFEETVFKIPPSGAGDCAAPKMLHFAYIHDLEPLCMAEFWWGVSPISQIRQHRQFYPSCRGKCEPILGHMLDGLIIEDNPLEQYNNTFQDIEIIYEDDDLVVVNKPHEFLSVPGKSIKDSVFTRMKKKYPDLPDFNLVHRLDMSTSGVLICAKTKHAYKYIQRQFIERKTKKTYVAIVDGVIKEEEGHIKFPMRVDLEDRPRQMICYEHGKMAVSRYKVISVEEGKTRINFFPVTGRTHQLRVHAAHKLGLGSPIVGDDLYGTKAERLYLHAEKLVLRHPTTRVKLVFKAECPF